MKANMIGQRPGRKHRLIGMAALASLMPLLLGGCYFGVGDGYVGAGYMNGSGDMVDGEFSVDGPITTLDLENLSAVINLSAEPSDKITYSIDDNLMQYLDISESDGRVKISSTNLRMLGRGNRIVIHIGTDSLKVLKAGGDFNIRGNGVFEADQFDISLAGAARAELDLEAQGVDVDLAGAVDLSLTGNTDNLSISSSGAAHISSVDLIAGDVSIDSAGACDVEVYARDNLDISSAGAGSVTYWGDPELSKSVAGFNSIRKGD